MRIRNLWLSTAWKGIFAMLAAVAVALDFGFFAGRADLYILNYYTLLSNIACIVFFAMAYLACEKALRRGERDFAWRPRSEGFFVFCIAVTGIVYATMLAPIDIAAGNFATFKNLMLHYAGPSMVILDWLMFSPKGRFRPTDPLLWLCAPLGYFGYILVRSTFAGDIGETGSRFPYGFIDPAVQGGWGEMLCGVLFIALGMAALGYTIFALDRLLRNS
jgi:hypothetical protein